MRLKIYAKFIGTAVTEIFAAIAAIATLALAGCASVGKEVSAWQQPLVSSMASSAGLADLPPAAPREFRAAWVATVANIDWPSKRDLTVAQQQAEIINIVDHAKELNLNALLLQVRTSADALYPSEIEPWSEYLTGEQGRAPMPFYDPLKMWIDESHKRGIELHAWFNPYRARHTQAKSPQSPTHIANTIPAAVKSYGGYLWMDPGEAAASNQTLNVILDVVRRYDIDGVHIDDYFYPYPVPVPGSEPPLASADESPAARVELPFPDEPSWQRYLLGGGKLARDHWRRQNVNALIEKIYRGIHREKNWVKFGISPFGLGKPSQRPAGILGFSQYDKLYADAELWLQNGWCDYFTPQLYWPIQQTAQAYGTLLDYWLSQNTSGRHIWPGMFTSRINGTEKSWQPAEILEQIALTRDFTRTHGKANEGVSGHVHFSMTALTENRRSIGDQLKATPYASAALVPSMTWLNETVPAMPQVTAELVKIGKANIKLQLHPDPSTAKNSVGGFAGFAIWQRYGADWRFSFVPRAVLATPESNSTELDLYVNSPAGTLNSLVVTLVDRFGNESSRVLITPSNEQRR